MKRAYTQLDVSRFGSVAVVNGRIVMGTWSMHSHKCLDLYYALGDKARYQDTGEFVHEEGK